MPNLIAVAGYISPSSKKGVSSVLTLEGVEFEVNEEEIKKRFPLDTAKEGAVRMFINSDAQLSVSMKASQLFSTDYLFGRKWIPKAFKPHHEDTQIATA